jgi:hypothetical protein
MCGSSGEEERRGERGGSGGSGLSLPFDDDCEGLFCEDHREKLRPLNLSFFYRLTRFVFEVASKKVLHKRKGTGITGLSEGESSDFQSG